MIIVSALYSMGEILFSTYSLEALRGSVSAEDAPKAVSLYTFLTTSIGLGLGQYVGVLLLDGFSIFLISGAWLLICAFGILLLKVSTNEKNCASVSA